MRTEKDIYPSRCFLQHSIYNTSLLGLVGKERAIAKKFQLRLLFSVANIGRFMVMETLALKMVLKIHYQMITYSVYTVGNSATRATYTFLEALHNVFDKKYCSSRYFLRKYYYRLLWKCISFWVWVIFFSCKYRKKIVILTF